MAGNGTKNDTPKTPNAQPLVAHPSGWASGDSAALKGTEMKTQKPDWSVERTEQRWAGNLLKTWLSSIDPQINTKAGKAVRCTFNETCAFNGNERVAALVISTNIDFAGRDFVTPCDEFETPEVSIDEWTSRVTCPEIRSLHQFVDFLNQSEELKFRQKVVVREHWNTGHLELVVKVADDLD